jgi:hypothetical protein
VRELKGESLQAGVGGIAKMNHMFGVMTKCDGARGIGQHRLQTLIGSVEVWRAVEGEEALADPPVEPGGNGLYGQLVLGAILIHDSYDLSASMAILNWESRVAPSETAMAP